MGGAGRAVRDVALPGAVARVRWETSPVGRFEVISCMRSSSWPMLAAVVLTPPKGAPAGNAVPCVLVVGAAGCGGGTAGDSDSGAGVTGADGVVARGSGRNASQNMKSTSNTAAAAIIPVSRRSTMRAICEDPRPRR